MQRLARLERSTKRTVRGSLFRSRMSRRACRARVPRRRRRDGPNRDGPPSSLKSATCPSETLDQGRRLPEARRRWPRATRTVGASTASSRPAITRPTTSPSSASAPRGRWSPWSSIDPNGMTTVVTPPAITCSSSRRVSSSSATIPQTIRCRMSWAQLAAPRLRGSLTETRGGVHPATDSR